MKKNFFNFYSYKFCISYIICEFKLESSVHTYINYKFCLFKVFHSKNCGYLIKLITRDLNGQNILTIGWLRAASYICIGRVLLGL